MKYDHITTSQIMFDTILARAIGRFVFHNRDKNNSYNGFR